MKVCRCLLPVFLVLLPVLASAGEVRLKPEKVVDGGTAVLRWTGPVPAVGVVRFRDQIIYLYPDPAGAVALLPVPLGTADGTYPVTGAIVDPQGGSTPFQQHLTVRRQERPLEKLTLPEAMVSPRAPAVLDRISREAGRLKKLFTGTSERRWKEFVRPVDDPVSSVFGKQRLLNGKPRAPHSGTDFRSPIGTPVRAFSTGRVVLTEELFYTGKTVVLDHGEGLFSIYAHLSSSLVMPEELVAVGSVIGKVGSSGRSTGPHLHLSVRLLETRVDPLLLLQIFQAHGS